MCARVDVNGWMWRGVRGRVCKDEVVDKLGKEKLKYEDVRLRMCGGERGFEWIKV